MACSGGDPLSHSAASKNSGQQRQTYRYVQQQNIRTQAVHFGDDDNQQVHVQRLIRDALAYTYRNHGNALCHARYLGTFRLQRLLGGVQLREGLPRAVGRLCRAGAVARIGPGRHHWLQACTIPPRLTCLQQHPLPPASSLLTSQGWPIVEMSIHIKHALASDRQLCFSTCCVLSPYHSHKATNTSTPGLPLLLQDYAFVRLDRGLMIQGCGLASCAYQAEIGHDRMQHAQIIRGP